MLLLSMLGFLPASNRTHLSDLLSIVSLIFFQNVQTHRFTLATLSTWRENQLLWHFISLFAVAIETGYAGEDCMRVCVCAFSTGAISVTEFLYKIKSPKNFAMASIN